MLLTALFFATAVQAQNLQGLNHLRFGCSQISIERLDPLVNPGMLGTPHVHQIVGGNAFNASMASTDISKLATCTTCGPADDFSNYWTANVYFKARNGTFKRVPQIPNRLLFNDKFTTQTSGGLVVYYIAPKKNTVTAFKPGFRMLVGDPNARSDRHTQESRQSSFRCFGENFEGGQYAPGTGNDTRHFPNKPCTGGIRSNIFFPTCWDGVNLDSPDHKSHVSFPAGNGSFEMGSPCPASHPIKLPQLFYEVMWDTRGFNDLSEWPEDGSQPFVLSTGDATGYGQHADYVFGWKGDALQRAMDQRCYMGCPALKTQDVTVANQCTQTNKVDEVIEGWLDSLPGGHPITWEE